MLSPPIKRCRRHFVSDCLCVRPSVRRVHAVLRQQYDMQYEKTRNSSGDEIANVNFLYDDIVHVLQNTIDSCINSATDQHGYVLERMCSPNSVK